jgi:hypothetical protein
MEPRLTLVTLGVRDLPRAIAFYCDGLGWPMSSASQGDFAVFQLANGVGLALHPRHLLAADAKLADGPGGFGGITLAYISKRRKDVKPFLEKAVAAGATLLKPAKKAEWGGYSGYFADPDGHPWEVAWNPHFRLLRGKLVLPA